MIVPRMGDQQQLPGLGYGFIEGFADRDRDQFILHAMNKERRHFQRSDFLNGVEFLSED
ncbi:hypothetical protein [Phormidesmis priestleyi]|uniref:hypothetical protein n=1 Tax=Phormidesmis priestleyi TaxID=268141 RepID=UPI0012E78D94|nr:hypothetical protein [Phormidesmis priestleyi]